MDFDPTLIASLLSMLLVGMLEGAGRWMRRSRARDLFAPAPAAEMALPASVPEALAGVIHELSAQIERTNRRLDDCLESREELREEFVSAINDLRHELSGKRAAIPAPALSDATVRRNRDILRLHRAGKHNQQQIAEKVGCSRTTVGRVIKEAERSSPASKPKSTRRKTHASKSTAA